ncbi:MAG TPA: hypothetical protein VN105_17450, partial [Chitinophaga sp.]|nr:hypothetical protein [Chitinophaga sp.]
MRKTFILFILALVSTIACRKHEQEPQPPVVDHNDTIPYNVTTLMDVEAHIAGMAIADDGTIFYSVRNKIYMIKDSVKSLFAGGEAGYEDGPRASARFNYPARLALDQKGNLYVADRQNYRIRKIDRAGNVSTMIFSYANPVYDDIGHVVEIVHDTTSNAGDVCDLNVKGNHLYIIDYQSIIAYNGINGYNTAQCRLDSNNFLSKGVDLYTGGSVKGLDVSQDEHYLYWGNIYGIYRYDLRSEEIALSYGYDNSFVNFVLGEGDSVMYIPRMNKCIIDRVSLATGIGSLIAGQVNDPAQQGPHPSIDGVGTGASFNHLNFIKKKNNYLYIAESNY